MEKKSNNLLLIVICVIILAGFKTDSSEYTGVVVNANIHSETEVKRSRSGGRTRRRKHEKTYYDVYLLVEDEKGTREIKIQDKKIASNFSDYLGEEVKVKKKTKSWYGKNERNYSNVIDYSI